MTNNLLTETINNEDTQQKNVEENKLGVSFQFSTPIFLIEKLNFLENVTNISDEYLNKKRNEKIDELYPVVMSENFFEDERIKDFVSYIGGTAWDILNEQGYEMSDKVVIFTEMWTQEHFKHSTMEQHVHGLGSQIVGFYFLDVPEKSSTVAFHDPRPGKVMVNLPEKDLLTATVASQNIHFIPKPGLLMFTNSWLPHSFTRHGNDKPIKFVHFNIAVQMANPPTKENANSVEVV
jgi:uncharacterized protein (TIGR02466 family)